MLNKKRNSWDSIKDTFHYKGLKQEIRKSGKKPPEWLEENGIASYRTQLRHNALSIVKLRDIMKLLGLPVPYFFVEYQELLAETAFIRNQLEEIQRVLNELPDSHEKTKILNILKESE